MNRTEIGLRHINRDLHRVKNFTFTIQIYELLYCLSINSGLKQTVYYSFKTIEFSQKYFWMNLSLFVIRDVFVVVAVFRARSRRQFDKAERRQHIRSAEAHRSGGGRRSG